MKIQRFEIPGLAQYSYVVSADGKAVVIDPIRDFDRYTVYARSENLAITHVLETHIHADFASGAPALAQAASAELALSAYDEGEHYRYAMPHRRLYDGDVVEVGSARLRALHTPGHTPEHLSFVLIDTSRSHSEPVALFSGDFLFVGSLGRPDLLGDEAKNRLAHELFRSAHERIASLPDGVEVYPGHGAGSFCGSGMSDRPESTLGYERTTNALFTLNEAEFMEQVLSTLPPTPRYYARMKEFNAKGAPTFESVHAMRALSPRQLSSLLTEEKVTVIDLRRPEAFGGAHIRNAINIGAGQNLSLWAGWMLEPEDRIVLVDNAGEDDESRRALLRVGLDHVEGFLEKGMPSWIEAGLGFERVTQVSTAEVERRPDEAVVVDVRSPAEWSSGHIAGAQHVMLGDLQSRIQELPEDRPLVMVCGSGYRSSIAASLLARGGFTQLSSMDGGMTAWEQSGRPVVR